MKGYFRLVATDFLMFMSVLVCRFNSVANILFHSRVKDQFLADGMAGQLPSKHILVAGLLVRVLGTGDNRVVGFNLAMILFDGVGDSRHSVYSFE